MAHGATAGMQRENTIRTCPGVAEQWIGATVSTPSMTVVTGDPTGKISGPHQHRMGGPGTIVIEVAIKVRKVAGDTLATRGVTGCAALKSAGTYGMTGGARQVDLTAPDKRGQGGLMTTGSHAG